MLSSPSRIEILNAYQLLFGAQMVGSIDFLRGLDPLTLKIAYRKKALETHPDRAKTLGRNEMEMNRNFQNVALAYEILSPFLESNKRYVFQENPVKPKSKREKTATKRNTAPPKRKPSPKKMNASTKKRTANPRQENVYDYFYRGHVPKKELLTGQFLYYSGFVSWRTFIGAIAWQKTQRPAFGQIAREWGLLTTGEIQKILVERSHKEKIGEYALDKGYINTFQLMAIMGKQRMLQRPIGEYFITKGILSTCQMDKMVQKLKSHNMQIKCY